MDSALPRIAGDERTLIGFITFDNAIHFYNLSHKLSQPQMMVVPDVNDILLPMPSDIMVNLSDCRKNGIVGCWVGQFWGWGAWGACPVLSGGWSLCLSP